MKKLVVISLIAAMVCPSVQCAAAKNLTPVNSITSGGHTYELYDESMTWNEAYEYCKDNGGYLATITSAAEQAAIEILMETGDKKQYWIGLTMKNEPKWVTGEAFEYSNWDNGEPNNCSRSDGETEDYVHIYNNANPVKSKSERFKWNDMYYDNVFPGEEDNFGSNTIGFICEIEKTVQVQNKVTVNIPEDAVEYNGHSYIVYKDYKSWEDAEEYCESLGGHLAVITTGGEQDFVEEIVKESNRACWLGGYRDASEKSWHWITGEEFSYTHWDDGEPTYKYENTDSDEIYTGIYANDTATDYSTTGMWNDFRPNTDTIKGFVCEWDTLGFKKSTSNWSTPEIQEAYENDLIPEFLVEEDLTENISRAEFASVFLKLYEALTGETVTSGESLPFNDVDGLENYSDIQKAYKLDIAVGTSPVTFEPYADINREQLVTMLTRTLKKYKYPEWTIETDSEYALLAGSVSKKFADDEDISDFARNSVYYMSEMGIVTGVDATHFAPKNTTVEQEAEGYAAATREQALALSLRILKKADLL